MRRRRLLVGAGTIVTTLLLSGTVAGSAEATPPPVTLDVTVGAQQQTTAKGAFRVEQVPTATGRMRVKITSGLNAVTTTASPGSVIHAAFTYGNAAKDGTREGAADVTVTPPDDSGVDPAAVARDYKASGRSVVTDAMESGLTYEEAVAQFGDMDPASVPTKAQAQRVVNGGAAGRLTFTADLSGAKLTSDAPTAERRASTVQALTTATAYDSWCTDVSANGGDQTAHGCIIRYLDYSSGGLRYWTHKQKVTAKDNSFWMVMSSTTQRYIAPTGNSVVDWDPYQTQSVGNCNTYTVGATDPKTGVSASYSGTVCPNNFGPSFSDSNRGYGSYWGGTSNDYVGAHSISVVKTSPGYSSNGSLKVMMTWRLN